MTVMCHWVGWLLESGNVSTMIDRMRMDMEREKKYRREEGRKGWRKTNTSRVESTGTGWLHEAEG